MSVTKMYVTDEDRYALAWVRDHGGLDAVRAEWRSRVPYDRYERRRQNLLRHIAECETALGRRNRRVEELGHRVSDLTNENAELRKRAMPEGMEWILWDDGKPVTYDDAPDDVIGVYLALDGSGYVLMTDLPDQLMSEPSDRVKRPAVPAADGEPLEVGQTVWDEHGDELQVLSIENDYERHVTCHYEGIDGIKANGWWLPSQLTHQRPVLDADGNRIEPAMDVWWVCEGDERGVHAERLHVESIGENGLVTCDPFNGGTWVELEPSELYVNRPVLDADGVPIRDGDTVYLTDSPTAFVVDDIMTAENGSDVVHLKGGAWNRPQDLTHDRPDTWERIEEDARLKPLGYVDRVLGWDMSKSHGQNQARSAMTHDLVRRCRALAERERGE